MALYIPRDGELLTATDARDRALEEADSPRPADIAPLDETPGFEPIGINKPLTIMISHVFSGRHPGRSFLGGERRRDLLVTSAIKSYSHYDAAPRAVNFYAQGVGARTNLTAPAAVDKGTALVFYTPAVTDASMTLTVELSFDDFPDRLLSKLSGAFQSLSSVPIFLPYAGYLMIGSGIAKLASDVGRQLFEGRPDFAPTIPLDFDIPGHQRPEAAFRIVAGNGLDISSLSFEPRKGLVLKANPTKLYDGDEPYIVLSLDGRLRPELAQFTPTLASAELLADFMSSANKDEAIINGLVEAAKLANDSKYRLEADRLARDIEAARQSGAAPADIERLTQRREAILKNITSEYMKPPVASAGNGGGNRPASLAEGEEPAVESPGHDADAVASEDDDEPAGDSEAPLDAARASKPWRVAKALLKLREQVNAKFPNRSKASDGTIGDAAHRLRSSDHNPWIDGGRHDVVSAFDITHDPANGCDCHQIYQALVQNKDPRVKYIIWDRHITNASAIGTSPAWAKRRYNGINPHTRHLHLSVKSAADKYDNAADWAL